MINFSKFPISCQYDDGRIAQMGLHDLEQAFKNAEKLLCTAELLQWQRCMWLAIERIRHNPPKATLQKVVDWLEQRKSSLRRQYFSKYDVATLLKCKEVDKDIGWLSGQYELQRRSRPYYSY